MVYRKHQIRSRDNEQKNRNAYLFALVVNVNLECRILFLESVERSRKVGSFQAFWFDRQRNHRLRNEHRRLRNGHEQNSNAMPTMTFTYHGEGTRAICESISRRAFNTEHRANFPRPNRIDILVSLSERILEKILKHVPPFHYYACELTEGP